MDLLDRYLQAVKKHLPWNRQEDILAELRANLEAQLEDKEAELGRPLTAGEMEAWLKELGPPMQVAARYQPQQYLIGPAVFPTYWYVVQIALVWTLVIYSVVSTVQIFVAGRFSATGVVAAVLRVPGVLITTAAVVTLVFAAFEFAVTHYPTKFPGIPGTPGGSADWSPSALPPVEKESTSGKKPRSFAKALAEVVFGFLFLGWLLLIPQHPFLLMGPGAAYLQISSFQLAPVWIQFYWGIVALNILQLAWRCADLWNESWQQPWSVQHLAIKALGLIPLALLLTARDHVLILLKHPAMDQARYGRTMDTINYWGFRGLLIMGAIVVLQLLWDLGRLAVDGYRNRTAE